MSKQKQSKSKQSKKPGEAQWNCLVGMDAHSEQATLCITEWEHGSEPRIRKEMTVELGKLEEAYRRHVPPGSLTVLEASTNAFSIAGRLEEAGQRAAVVCSDTLRGFTRGDKVTDRHDARNLARAYARGSAREVWVPDAASAERRELLFAYRDARKDAQAAGSRIWGFCSRLGLPEPGLDAQLPARLAGQIAARHGEGSHWALRCESLVEDWRRCTELKAHWGEHIEAAVAGSEDAARLMQVLGIGPLIAFALIAIIGDIRRFETSSQLVAYAGLNPSIAQSGKSEGRGGLSRHGRKDLKSFLIEGAHSAMAHGREPMHEWARRLVKSGKAFNLALCALARKMLVQAWHILMGHPPLNPAPTANHRRKLTAVARSAQRIGALEGLGYRKVTHYVLDMAAKTASPPKLQRASVRGELFRGELSQNLPRPTQSSTSKSLKL